MKVVHEESKGKHKLSLKIGDEFTGKGMEEIEAYLDSHVSMVQCMSLLNTLGYKLKSTIHQLRQNYKYKDVSISVKYTPSWKYHFEAEMMVQSKEEAVIARSHILDICQELGISPMGTEELKEFVTKLEAK